MNTLAVREKFHEKAIVCRSLSECLREMHQIMREKDGPVFPADLCRRVSRMSREQHKRADTLDRIANQGTDEEVIRYSKRQFKNIGKNDSWKALEEQVRTRLNAVKTA